MADIGPAELLRRRVAADPGRPFVTFYDDATGERVELSARTFDNWVAKTANLLVDGLDAEPGETVVLALPTHWQTAVWLFACWSAGLVAEPIDVSGGVVEPADPAEPYLLVIGEEVLTVYGGDRRLGTESLEGGRPPTPPGAPAAHTDSHGVDSTGTDDIGARDIVGLSLNAFGAPLRTCPPGVVDYAVEVRGYGDGFTPYPPGPALRIPTGPTVDGEVRKTTLGAAELGGRAAEAARKWGLDARSRVLVDVSFATLDGLLAGLLAPTAAGGSVIIQRNFDKASLDRRITLEHVTAVAGATGWNDASGSAHRLL